MTLSNDSRDHVKGVFEPIALAMGRAGLTPDALTVMGFIVTVVGAVLLSQQLWLAGGLVVFAGGVFDMFDGTLARATGRVSTFGAFLDSVFDKAGEIVVFVGIIAGLLGTFSFASGSLLAAAAMGAAVMVSYTRARSEGLGFSAGTGMAAVGIMPREIRLVVLSLGLVLTDVLGTSWMEGTPCGFMPCEEDGPPPTGIIALFIALAIIAIGGILTTIQRILHVRSQALQQSTTTQTETDT